MNRDSITAGLLLVGAALCAVLAMLGRWTP
jgi:cytochrome oxidase assembly protein ShyY1